MSDITSIISPQMTAALERQQIRKSSNAEEPDRVKQEKEFREVAKEMESLFAYQLLKVMRKTSEGLSTEKKESGHDTYMGLFDMEISKLLSERGLGLQDSIVNWLNRTPDKNSVNKDEDDS